MVDLGPSNGSLTIHTSRQGMAARAGHDLVIDVERWRATLDASGLNGTIEAGSLAVREGHGGVKALSASDKTEIQKNLNEKILRTAQNPHIAFASGPLSAPGDGIWTVNGQLTLVGVTNPVAIPVTLASSDSEVTLTASVTIVQSQFRIKPYSGLMGALKVADAVEIRAQARIPKADWPF
jgi:polyisoprenoid-binding protein YceI